MTEYYQPINRPDWTNFFLGLAFFIAERSEDAETQHGCILTKENRIIATGCNGFARGVQSGELPNVRPYKYPYIIHSEQNAIDNSTVDLRSIPGGAICYITAKPCLSCLYRLHNNYVRTIYYADTGYYFQGYERETLDFDNFVSHRQMTVYRVEPQLAWLKKPMAKLADFT